MSASHHDTACTVAVALQIATTSLQKRKTCNRQIINPHYECVHAKARGRCRYQMFTGRKVRLCWVPEVSSQNNTTVVTSCLATYLPSIGHSFFLYCLRNLPFPPFHLFQLFFFSILQDHSIHTPTNLPLPVVIRTRTVFRLRSPPSFSPLSIILPPVSLTMLVF